MFVICYDRDIALAGGIGLARTRFRLPRTIVQVYTTAQPVHYETEAIINRQAMYAVVAKSPTC